MRHTPLQALRVEIVLLLALAVWGLFPVALLLAHAADLHARFTGADGLIGVDGVLGADQLQYLAWARDAATQGGLASDLFTLSRSGHVYLEPVLAVTAVLYRLGLSLPLAYLLWKPVAILAIFLAAAAWASRTVGDRVGPRLAVIALSLFLYTPLAALFSWTRWGSGGPLGFPLYLLGNELLAADKLWGYVPSALGEALVPAVLLCAERALAAGDGAPPAGTGGGARLAGTVAWRAVRVGPLLLAAAAAGLASWLHPWQGITLILIFAGLALPGKMRRAPALLVPALAAGLPLIYYSLLAHRDPAWELASRHEVIARLPAVVLLAGLGPLALIAALGLRRPGGDLIEQGLLLWIGGCFITYFANDSFAPHALQGLSFPWAVLAVRGGQRLHLGPALGAAAVLLMTVPGLAYDARKFVRTAAGSEIQYYLPEADADALDWVTEHAPPGGVLAPTPFAATIPSQTGRNVWVGNGYWSQNYEARARQADRLFGGRMSPAAARRFVASTGATILISDCRHAADLSRDLRGDLAAVHSFGCARVYVLSSG